MDDLAVGCRALLGVVFVVSAVSKVAGRNAFPAFTRSLQRMRVVPAGLARVCGVAVVAGEFVIAAALAVPSHFVAGLGFVLAFALIASFTAAIVSVLARKIDTTCRCFGRTDTPLGPQHLGRNVFLLGVAGLGWGAESYGTPAQTGALIVAALAGAFAGGLVAVFDDLVHLVRPPSSRARA